MTDTVTVFSILDRLGRGVVEAFFIPSLEALLLGAVVWFVLRLDQGHAPRIRHILWLLVVFKPLLSLILPWQGPFPVPVLLTSVPAVTIMPTGYAGEHSAWLMEHPYAVIAAIWGIAICTGVVWTLMGVFILFRRGRQTMPIPVPWVQTLFTRCLSIVDIPRPIQLRMSDEFASPTLIVIGKPLVVIPSWCLVKLSPQELKQVFLHELIHYTRRDHLTLFMVQLAKICFFFHPLVWYAGKRIGVEAERACDVAVVTASPKPQSYAASLLKVAEGALRARWHGVLEFARSASLTAIRIKDVLNGFDDRLLAIKPRTILLLVACGVGSVMPFFHIPASQFVSNVSDLVECTLLPPAVSEPALISSTSLDLSTPIGSKKLPGTSGSLTRQNTFSEQTALSSRPRHLTPIGKPYAPTPFTTALIKSESPEPVDKGDANLPEPHLSMLRLPSQASSNDNTPAGATQWEPGQIEVQGIGHTLAQQGFSGRMSLRAGYFVTKAHEFGGVLSIITPRAEFETTERQEDANSRIALSKVSSISTRRIASISPSQDDENKEPSNQTVKIGAFYRYNLAGLSKVLVPFVGVGTGIEMRSGRNPVMVDGGGGVRCFFTRHAALIIQIDYVKDVELTTRSRINASLGFSTIF